MISLKDRTGYFKITSPWNNFCIFKLENGEGESLLSTIKIYSYPLYYFDFNNEEEVYYHFDGCIVEELTLEEVNQLKAEEL